MQGGPRAQRVGGWMHMGAVAAWLSASGRSQQAASKSNGQKDRVQQRLGASPCTRASRTAGR